MGHRLSNIYTRTGDDGTTGLGDGTRVKKTDARIEAFGAIDEFNCTLGLLLAEHLPVDIRTLLTRLQHELFDLGGELCIPGRIVTQAAQVERLENHLDRVNGPLPPLKEFILPGGSRAAALAHLARTVCRRAERRVIALSEQASVNPRTVHYLNRLSDLLFVMARDLNRTEGQPDVLWQPEKNR